MKTLISQRNKIFALLLCTLVMTQMYQNCAPMAQFEYKDMASEELTSSLEPDLQVPR